MKTNKCSLVADGDLAGPVYEVKFTKLFRGYEYDIDAQSGRIVKSRKEPDW